MKVSEILASTNETRFSLEIYPPKAHGSTGDLSIQKHLSAIFNTIEHLQKFDPVFVSVTYNPEGKTRATSILLAALIKQRYDIDSVAHLTCIATPREELDKSLDVLDYFEIENVLALRGDKPDTFVPLPGTLNYAFELVDEIMLHNPNLCIGVASYPEGHPECIFESGERDLERDLENFRNKINKGASFSISQLFLDNAVYFDFLERTGKTGVEIPIIPGIIPIIDYKTLDVIKGLCEASVPEYLERRLKNNSDDPAESMAIGVEHAIRQCKQLMDKVPCIHFYTMDKWEPTERILEALR